MHKWKAGDWCEYKARRLLVIRVVDAQYPFLRLVDFEGGGITLEFDQPKHLPGCTGWDWQPTPREWWVNVYAAGDVVCDTVLHQTKERADKTAGSNRSACIKVREVIE